RRKKRSPHSSLLTPHFLLHGAVFLDLARQRASHGRADAVDIESEVRQQFAAFAVLDEAIRQSKAEDVTRLESGAIGCLQDSAAEAAFKRAFLDGDDERQLLDGPQQRGPVERLDEAGVDDADVESFLAQRRRRLDARWEQAAEGDQYAIL